MKVIVGGMAVNPGAPTLPNAVILVAGQRLHMVGSDSNVQIPPGSMSWSARNRYVIPAPVEWPANLRLRSLETLAAAKALLKNPPHAAEGIVSDADEFPRDCLARFAASKTIVVPRLAWLATSPMRLARGLRHVRTLRDAGVPLASFGDSDALSEWRLLARAGLTPEQILTATTVNAARAARQASAGLLEAGFLANLWLLRGDPLAAVDNLTSVDGIMVEGAWRQSAGAPA